ncbi:UDP:flavonoid glycosyltransferase YjiC (YdhE family) [Jatrophihabitans sp. GAS493]|uniref:glycosyltransferase n=1 Tax=Jatrophihabitans sp. GAS493 TaxID=1907575 RepID=UPI000BB8E199|nr:glycosyltransferase [Jatrophihabitans sp. GAS493]SOD70820.1 UDP:flavonoid glycosyltransferase YjiC (YdhE family) [Jatrophihabitans sp. GAS493]
MRIVLAALGSRGDTQPCVALAEGLMQRGHDVTVLASERYAHVVRGVGLTHVPISFDPQEMVESEEGQAMLAGGALGFVRGIRNVIEPLAERTLSEMEAACEDAELILAPAMGGCGRHIAERYGIPHGILQFQPSEPTGAFANPVITARNLGGTANRATFALIEGLTWAALARMTNRLRRSVLGLAPLRRSTFHYDRAAAVPMLCGVSSVVVPRPLDWPANVHMTGFWLRSDGRPLEPSLAEFLDTGPPPVYVGFGSMTASEPRILADVVRAALHRTGLRGVVQGLPRWNHTGDTVYFVDEVDHAMLFPQMAATVHHGGAGTTATALRAGVPSVVCPFFGDQPFWGNKVTELGVGPAPAPMKDLDADRLARRLRVATSDRSIREKSALVGSWLQAEDGVENACRIIDDTFAPTGRREVRIG